MAKAFMLSSPIESKTLEELYESVSKKAAEFYDVKSKGYYSEEATKYLEDIIFLRQIAKAYERATTHDDTTLLVRESTILLQILARVYYDKKV
jgi:hypothetical protein